MENVIKDLEAALEAERDKREAELRKSKHLSDSKDQAQKLLVRW